MVRSVSGAWAAKCRMGGAVGGTDDRLLSSVGMGPRPTELHEQPPSVGQAILPADTLSAGPAACKVAWFFAPVDCTRLTAHYLVDSRGTRLGSINTVLAGRLRLELMDLISMSAACCPMAVLLWSMVESGTRNRLEEGA